MARFRRIEDDSPAGPIAPGPVGEAGLNPLIEPWLAAGALAELLRVSTDWVYEKAASGELPSYVFGGHRRFRLSEIEAWASQNAYGPQFGRTNGRRSAG